MTTQPTVLYLHIPKAGGTTLSDWLYQQLRDQTQRSAEAEEDRWLSEGVFYYPSGYVRGPYDHDTAIINRVLQRPDVNGVLGHFQFGVHSRLAKPVRYVTMLRHPVERILSLYHFERLMQERYGEHQGIRMPKETTLESFLQSPPFEEIDNGMVRRISGVSPRLGGCTDDMLQQAKANLRDHFEVVGATERFDETLVLLARSFGWSQELLYYPRNVTVAGTHSSRLPKATVDLIREHNRYDIALYEFGMRLLDEAIAAQGQGFVTELERFRAAKISYFDDVGGWNMPAEFR